MFDLTRSNHYYAPRCQRGQSETTLYSSQGQCRRLAQFGSALGLGPRGRWFESSLADHS